MRRFARFELRGGRCDCLGSRQRRRSADRERATDRMQWWAAFGKEDRPFSLSAICSPPVIARRFRRPEMVRGALVSFLKGIVDQSCNGARQAGSIWQVHTRPTLVERASWPPRSRRGAGLCRLAIASLETATCSSTTGRFQVYEPKDHTARCWVKNAVSLSNGITSTLSYRSVWTAFGTITSSLGSAAFAYAVSLKYREWAFSP